MVMVSSPAKKVEAAREREMERGVLPKNEMVEEDELEEEEAEGALPLLPPMGVVMVKIGRACRACYGIEVSVGIAMYGRSMS